MLRVSDLVVSYGRVESEQVLVITNRVMWVGTNPYSAADEMPRYFSPNKSFEFIVPKMPTIATDLPYLRDVIDEHKIGWSCDAESPKRLPPQRTLRQLR